MKLWLLSLALGALTAQDPQPSTGILLAPEGGVQAPAQPTGSSSATYTRGARIDRKGGQGSNAPVRATIDTLVDVRGQEQNSVSGIGLVTGLGGTGDSTNMARQIVQNLLLARNIRIDPQQLTPKNVAVVQVDAMLPAGMQPGRHIDVRVSTIGDAKSLQGGVLVFMELADPAGVVYATASGPVDVGGFLAEGSAASVAKNHVTVGTIPGGGKVERAIAANIVSEHGYLYLDARATQGSFANLVRIVDAINAIYPGAAEASVDGRSVKVLTPGDLPVSAHVAYLDSILRLEIEPRIVPRVVINERTGTIVIGEGVRLRPGAIALGNVTVTIGETPEASQPGPLSNGTTARLDRTSLDVAEDDRALVEVPGAVTLQQVVEVLNELGLSPRELISVLNSMSASGLLLAEVERL